MKLGEFSGFRDDQARQRYMKAYDATLDKVWPRERTALDVPTSLGTTRVYRTGPAAGSPVVLLPGSGGNSLMWHRHVGELSGWHEVIAIDTVGEPGASVQTASMADGAAGAAWLEEVLAVLDVTGAHMVGCSYGGWLALEHQLRHPGRTGRLTLVDPAGFAVIGWRFYRWLILGGLAGLAPRRLRPWLAGKVANSAILDDDLMALMKAAMGFKRRLPAPGLFTDEELARVSVPTLVLLGERSALHDARAVAERVERIVGVGAAEVVAGAGHSLPLDAPGVVVARILGGVGTGSVAEPVVESVAE